MSQDFYEPTIPSSDDAMSINTKPRIRTGESGSPQLVFTNDIGMNNTYEFSQTVMNDMYKLLLGDKLYIATRTYDKQLGNTWLLDVQNLSQIEL